VSALEPQVGPSSGDAGTASIPPHGGRDRGRSGSAEALVADRRETNVHGARGLGDALPTTAKHQAVASSEAQVVPGVTAGGTTVDLGALLEPRR